MMQSTIPWALLTRLLRRKRDARASFTEVIDAGADPEKLVQWQLAKHAQGERYQVDCCLHRCRPNIDDESLADQGLALVSCPTARPCFRGSRKVKLTDLRFLSFPTASALRALAVRNGIVPCDLGISEPIDSVGLLHRRGLAIPVVWVQDDFLCGEHLARSARTFLGRDGLIVLTPDKWKCIHSAHERIVTLEVPQSTTGRMDLAWALDVLVPEYRQQLLTNSLLDLDYVHIRFGTVPGKYHWIEINGQRVGACRLSDSKFLRALLLGLERVVGDADGWIHRACLRDGDARERAIERVRQEFATHRAADMTAPECRALVRSRQELIRLGVPAANIEFDSSLADLTLLGANLGRPTQQRQKEGGHNANLLLTDCRQRLERLGIRP